MNAGLTQGRNGDRSAERFHPNTAHFSCT